MFRVNDFFEPFISRNRLWLSTLKENWFATYCKQAPVLSCTRNTARM